MKSPVHVARTLLKHGAWTVGELARRGLPRDLVFFCGDTLGDDLMCTAILHEMRRRGDVDARTSFNGREISPAGRGRLDRA